MRKIIYLIIFLVIVVLSYIFYDSIFIPLNKNTKIEFEIKEGESSYLVAHNLEFEELIKSSAIFDLYMKFSGKYKNILPGKFQISDSMNVIEIANLIIRNPNFNFNEQKITIIEGWNLKQIGQYLEKQSFCTQEEWNKLIKSNDYDYEFIKQKPKNTDLEGYLFPDTHMVYKNSNCRDVINKLLNNFDNKLNSQMREDIEKQGKSLYEILTMASIVEKEVRSLEDMKIVSGIFWNRIRYGQALESCATLAYILGENKTQYSYEDTRVNSPYNTYINRGLPPGPINSPSLNSIMASIYPENSDYNYFLTDPKTGNTIFSRTFEEHKINKAKYLN